MPAGGEDLTSGGSSVADLTPEVIRRVGQVRLIIVDVDGVLTDGQIIYGTGGAEAKAFHVRDGAGVKIGQRAGLQFAVISGRASEIVERRAKELGIEDVYQGALFKLEAYQDLLRRRALGDESVAFIGDDLVDLPLLRRAGLAVAVADAAPEVREAAHYITALPGGRGAVREVIDLILKVQGLWDRVTERYRR